MRTHVPPPARTVSPARPRLDPVGPPPPRPLIRPAPRSAIFLPLVILVATLPGLAALRSWDLTVPGPLWGLRAMAVADGMLVDQTPAAADIQPIREAAGYRTVALQPPLYPWMAAVGLGLVGDSDPLGCVLPSYWAGVIAVILIYLHGRLWRGAGLGMAAALLLGFNPQLLLHMQEVAPGVLAVTGASAALYCYAARGGVVRDSSDPRLRSILWSAAGGFALGLSLLSVEAFGLIVIPVAVLHQLYLRASAATVSATRPRSAVGRTRWWRDGAPIDLAVGLGVAMLTALPWHLAMIPTHGWEVLNPFVPPIGWAEENVSLLGKLLELSPVATPLGLYGAARMIRLALIADDDDRETIGGALWVIWLAVGALALSFWSDGPRDALELFLLVPLNLLAAATVADLVNRRVPVRALIGLAPALILCLAWWGSGELRSALAELLAGRAGATTILGLHLVLDLIIVSILLTRWLDRWARGRDHRQRRLLACFLLATLGVVVALGVREMVFRHSETTDLLMLRTMILRRDRERPFELVAVVSPGPIRQHAGDEEPMDLDAPYPGGRLRFILRTALPRLRQVDLNNIDDLLTLPDQQRLIILYGAGQRLSYPLQSQLGLEAIHPGRSGILDAYATASTRGARGDEGRSNSPPLANQ